MARRKTKARSFERPISRLGFLLAAGGFGLACVAGGVLVLLFGAEAGPSSDPRAPDATSLGIGLIAVGIVAIGLMVFIVLSKSQKGKRRKRHA